MTIAENRAAALFVNKYPCVRRIWLLVYTVWLMIGLILVFTVGIPPWLDWSGGVYLFLAAGLAVMVLMDGAGDYRSVTVVIAIAAIAGWGSEWLGVHTGFPFGSYTYAAFLGPRLFGVPVAMGAAWASVLVIGWAFTPRYLNPLIRIAVAALLTTSLDFLVDPVASNVLSDWTWTVHGRYYGVPWRNFVAWFLISALLQSLFSALRHPFHPPKLAWFLFGTLTGMFAVIGFVNGLWLPALFGMVPCMVSGLMGVGIGLRSSRQRTRRVSENT